MKLKALVGSGDKIMLLTLPFLLVGLYLNLRDPALFSVGGPPAWLRWLSVLVLIVGVTIWLWSAWLVLTRVPRKELITSGPFALIKHPIYTGFSLMVLPWAGFLLDTWMGLAIGIIMYVADRIFAPEEERELSQTFGADWEAYRGRVMIPWL